MFLDGWTTTTSQRSLQRLRFPDRIQGRLPDLQAETLHPQRPVNHLENALNEEKPNSLAASVKGRSPGFSREHDAVEVPA